MSSLLYFVIPVRHQATVRDWGVIKHNLAETLASIAAQTHAGWECRLVANSGADLPPLPARCTVRFVDLPPPDLPDPRQGMEPYYDAIRHDKGLRIYEGTRDLPAEAFLMPVDYDDFVSNRLAEFVARNPEAPGWYIPQGYFYSGGRWYYRTRRLHRSCGTSHILKRRGLGMFETSAGLPDIAAIKRRLGSHLFNQPDLEGTPDALQPLPFPGVIYRLGVPGSASGTGGIFRAMTPPGHFLHHPLNALRRLTRYRLMTAKIRQEFFRPPSP